MYSKEERISELIEFYGLDRYIDIKAEEIMDQELLNFVYFLKELIVILDE